MAYLIQCLRCGRLLRDIVEARKHQYECRDKEEPQTFRYINKKESSNTTLEESSYEICSPVLTWEELELERQRLDKERRYVPPTPVITKRLCPRCGHDDYQIVESKILLFNVVRYRCAKCGKKFRELLIIKERKALHLSSTDNK